MPKKRQHTWRIFWLPNNIVIVAQSYLCLATRRRICSGPTRPGGTRPPCCGMYTDNRGIQRWSETHKLSARMVRAPTSTNTFLWRTRREDGKKPIWLKTLIPTIPKGDWVIAVGHHPADEIDVMDLTSLLQSADIDLYLNGHTHAMAQYSVDGNPSVFFLLY